MKREAVCNSKKEIVDFAFETECFPVKLTISDNFRKRSLSQNALFHKWVNELSVYLIKGGRKDSSPEFCKDLLKHTFLGYEQIERVNAKTGERVTVSQLKHTSELDLGDMNDFMNKCYAWCVDIGLLLTIPHDSEYAMLMEPQNG